MPPREIVQPQIITSRSHLAVAVMGSTLIILAAPFAGQIRAMVQDAFPQQFTRLVGGAVAMAFGAAVLVAFARVRARRGLRFGTIAAALALGVSFSVLTSTGNPDIDAVERVHFVEYGLVALLFYRVWRAAADPSMFILPIVAGLIVGTLDEWLQWFIPVRVGEARDVALNGTALVCGLLFGFAAWPPYACSQRLSAHSLTIVSRAAAAAVLIFAAFFSTVHLGYVVHEEGIGSFRSHYTAGQLDTLAQDRQIRWRTSPPTVLKRFSQEDQYMDEGLWHVRRRNQAWSAGDAFRARYENRVLERFFKPVLETRSYAAPDGNQWAADTKMKAEAPVESGQEPFVSDAEPYTLRAWAKGPFWLLVIVSVAFLAGTPLLTSVILRD